ncbi:MAG: fatty acid--CoA ligase family protein [Pseudomonadota bacterium]
MLFDVLAAFAADAPARPVLVCGAAQWRAADLAQLAERWTPALQIKKKRNFALAMRRPAECIAALAALSRLDGPVVLLKDGLPPQEIAALMERLGCEALVCDAATLSTLPPVLQASAIVLEQDTGAEPGTIAHPLPAAPDGEIRILTSGTTGAPKSIGHRWSDLVAATRVDDAPPRRWLLAYSLAHFAGLQVLLQALLHRDTLVACDTAQVPDLWTAAIAGGVTHLSSTPTFWRMAFASAASRPIPTLRHVTLGGEAVTQDVLDRIADLYPGVAISQIYASTELGSVLSVRDGRAGLPLHLFDDAAEGGAPPLRIVESELQVRCAQDGQFHYRATGDLVERTADRVVFLGRKSETINVGGFKVHPQQVEAVVSPIRGVLAAVAEGRPNPITGQIVRLRVVLRQGHHRDEVDAEIRSACRALSRHAQPRQILYVDALETTNMKLARRAP